MDFSPIHLVKEYPLYYPAAPATLREFASTKLAIDLWQYHYRFDCNNLGGRINHRFDTKQIFKITLPPRIREIIDQRIDSVRLAGSQLVQHFIKFGIFEPNIANNVSSKFDTIVYGPDATISDEPNAKKLLSSDKLTPMEKYKIAFTYCFEEEVRKLWPLVRYHPIEPLVGFFQNNQRIIIQYWDNEMRNSFREMEFHRGDIDWSKWKVWTAFEYFLNEVIPSDERFTMIDEVLQKENFTNVEYLLPKLNQAQADWVLEKYPHRIIVQLAFLEKYFDYMMKIWNRVKESITEENFSHIIKTLCSRSYQCIRRHPNRNKSTELDDSTEVIINNLSQLRNVLSEIWISAPFKLRSSFANNRAIEIIVELKNYDDEVNVSCYDYGMQFFSQLLADMCAESRDKIWRKYWLVFLTRSRPKNLQHFLNLCLKEKDIEEFGENELMNYEKVWPYIEFLLKKRSFDDVIDYTNFFPVDRPFVRKFRKQILESNSFLIVLFFTSYNKGYSKLEWFVKLAKFIDDCSDNAEDAKILKNKVFIRASSNGVLLTMLNDGWVDDVIRSSELFSLSEKDLLSIKQRLYKAHESHVLNDANKGEFCLSLWIVFSSWSDPGKRHLPRFMKSIPVDIVFKKKLHNVVEMLTMWLGHLELQRAEPVPSSVRKLEEFDVIDDFLKWYFGCETEAKNYKWNVILNCPEKYDLQVVLNAKNECIVNDVLKWFFNGDVIEIGYFKEKLRRGQAVY